MENFVPHRASFDYIFTGAGCAGLSLLMRMIQHEAFAGKQILVLDQDIKQSNDRTWCFWEQEAGFFEPIVYRQWEDLYFYAPTFLKKLDIKPYTYKLIRGIDFYQYCFEQLGRHNNIQFVQARVDAVESNAAEAFVYASGKRYSAPFVFNSIPPPQPKLQDHHYWLLQHFKGWVIETDQNFFNPSAATLMDFRVGQERGTTFVYVLPFGPRKALVEYTLFSKELLAQNEYDVALKSYLQQYLGITSFRIEEEEFGVIPMTNYDFKGQQHRVLNMGTAGGSTKPSSGYTFRFIQKRADTIIDSLLQKGHPFNAKSGMGRFGFYDSVLLHILANEQMPGAAIFTQLFQNNNAASVLRFLDNETRITDELRLLPSLPIAPFTKAALAHLRLKL